MTSSPSLDEIRLGAPFARRHCFLRQDALSHCEPLGFSAWDIFVAPSVARDLSGWLFPVAPGEPQGQVLFHARPEHLLDGPVLRVPVPTVPLLLWLTHRTLRVLYQCTPSEAESLGDRLSLLSARALGADRVEECSPAALADVLCRWTAEDRRTPTITTPLWADDEDAAGPPLTHWRRPWDHDLLIAPPKEDKMAPSARLLPPLHLRWRQAELLTYEEDPVVLCPVGVMFDSAQATPVAIDAAFFSEDDYARSSVVASVYYGMTSWIFNRMIMVLVPLLRQTWRDQLTQLRDRLGERLHSDAGCTPVRQETVLGLIDSLGEARQDLYGAGEIDYAPLTGARTSPPDEKRATELRRRLMNAVGLPLAEEVLRR